MQRALYFICSATPTDSICCFVTSYEERAPRLTLGTEYPPQSQSLSKGSHFLRALSHHARGSCQNCRSRAARGALTKTVTSGLSPKLSHLGLSLFASPVTSRAGLSPKLHIARGALTKTFTSRGSHQNCHIWGSHKTAHARGSHQNCTSIYRGALTKTAYNT